MLLGIYGSVVHFENYLGEYCIRVGGGGDLLFDGEGVEQSIEIEIKE